MTTLKKNKKEAVQLTKVTTASLLKSSITKTMKDIEKSLSENELEMVVRRKN